MNDNCNLIDIEDLFENENYVITKPYYVDGKNITACIDIATKDSNGDIVSVKTIDMKVL